MTREKAARSTPSSVESMPDADDPLGAALPPEVGQPCSTRSRPAAGPVGSIHVRDQHASHVDGGFGRLDPGRQAIDDVGQRWPAARCRAGVKNISR